MPLSNKTVLVTRAVGQNQKLVRLLQQVGAQTVELPTIQIAWPVDLTDLDRALRQLKGYHWLIFSSVNGVTYFWKRLQALNIPTDPLVSIKIGAIGPATAQAVSALGFKVDRLPREHIAEAFVETIGQVNGQRILFPTANIARPILATGLQNKGAIVDQVEAYQTTPALAPANLGDILAQVNLLTFTSSSTVDNFVQMLKQRQLQPNILSNKVIACIGPKTAASARNAGLYVDILAQTYTVEGLVAAIVGYCQIRQQTA